MPVPAPVPSWNLAELRFPKSLQDDPRLPGLRARLAASCNRLWAGSEIEVPTMPWSELLGAALLRAQQAGHLLPGVESAERVLTREARGLSLADARSATERGSRVSRLLLATNDGSERFYRQIERLLRTQGARLLALRIDITSPRLSSLLGNGQGPLRALLVEHKMSVSELLLTL